MVILSLTEQEAMGLQQLIDAAVRGQGLRVAEMGLFLNMKLVKAIEAASKPGNGRADPQSVDMHP